MTKISETIKGILHKFNIDPSTVGLKFEETPAPLEFKATAKLQDGTEISSTADAFAVGTDIYSKDASGADVALVAGEYMMEDGSKIVVDETGKIASMEPAEMEMSSEDLLKVVESLSERLTVVEAQNTELSAERDAEKTAKEAATTELASVKTELAALRKKPAVPSVKDKTAVDTKLAAETKEPKSGSREWFKEKLSQTSN